MNFKQSKLKKILFFTGTRADYGLLSSLIKLFAIDSNYNTQILASGTHLSDRFGSSLTEIENDGFAADYKIDIELVSDTDLDISKSSGLAVQRYAEVLQNSCPDLAFVLGDRFEALSFAISCQIMKIPLAHLHGGEITEGAIDNSFRHCITKLSTLHFASAEIHKLRILQMGENPDSVFNVGALGVDNVVHLKKKSKSELEQQLKIQFKIHNFMVTFHPETLLINSAEDQMVEFLNGLKQYIDHDPDSNFIFTMPNSDPGHQTIINQLSHFVAENNKQAILFSTMGKLNYLSTVALCCGVVGNSSSGLIEAPALGIPTLNVGDRQKGRLRGDSVVDVPASRSEIFNGLNSIVRKFYENKNIVSVYGNGQAALQIKKTIDLKIQCPISIRRTFYDRN